MVNPLRFFCAFTAFLLLAIPLQAQEKYLDQVELAVQHVEWGNYGRSAEALEAAFAWDANESLAHLCLATVYLHTGQVEQAVMEFKVALGLRKDDPIGYYGLGLALLGRPDVDGAIAQLEKVAGPYATDAKIVSAYLHGLTGEYGAASSHVEDFTDITSAQLKATALFKAGKLSEAKEAFLKLIEEGFAGRYQERPGTVMTYNPRAPIRFTGKPPEKLVVPPSIEAAKAPGVSGSITLRADLSGAPNVKFVLFFVDDQMVALVNHSPYDYSWDTTRHSNGLHTVRIQGQTTDNQIVNQKSMKVRVDNPDKESHVLTGERADALRARLWERLKLAPSLAAMHYMLAKCAMDEGDKDSYISNLEKVMAAEPDYFDARLLLKKAYGRTEPYRELRQGSANGAKTIALTFDDGPSRDTGKILDVLSREEIKATFFVVGQMCEENRDVLERIHQEGHDIQNHTYSHRNLKYIAGTEIEKELFGTIAIVKDVTSKGPIYFRPPGGHMNESGISIVGNFGLLPVYWTANCSRYEGTTPETMVRYVLSAASPGGIVLMHNGEDITLAALPTVIRSLKEKGYRFVTVSEMFSVR